MQILDLQPGSPEWKRVRGKYNTASEASVMMSASKNMTRNELLHAKATGTEKEFSDFVQSRILDKGHEVESMAKPLIESQIDDELYPVVAIDDEGELLASFDGLTMDEKTAWENKQWSQAKADYVAQHNTVPPEDYWQVVQQLVVSRAERCIYTITDGTEEKFARVDVTLDPADEKKLRAGWAQFNKDAAEYVPAPEKVEPEGKAPDSLPALQVQVTGEVIASNLEPFEKAAMSILENISTELETDEDFASAEKTVKWCSDVESRLKATKDQALGQTETIDNLFRTIDRINDEVRQKRLELDKKVKARKTELRNEIKANAESALREHTTTLGKQLGVHLPESTADFAGAMKGKKTLKSLQSAVDDELAKAKIEANDWAELIRSNLETLEMQAGDHRFLFNDLNQIVTKQPDDFEMLVKGRVSDHKEAQRKREEQERERIRREEEAKATEAASKSEAAKAYTETEKTAIPAPKGSTAENDIIECLIARAGLSEDQASKVCAMILNNEIPRVTVYQEEDHAEVAAAE